MGIRKQADFCSRKIDILEQRDPLESDGLYDPTPQQQTIANYHLAGDDESKKTRIAALHKAVQSKGPPPPRPQTEYHLSTPRAMTSPQVTLPVTPAIHRKPLPQYAVQEIPPYPNRPPPQVPQTASTQSPIAVSLHGRQFTPSRVPPPIPRKPPPPKPVTLAERLRMHDGEEDDPRHGHPRPRRRGRMQELSVDDV